MKLVHFLSADNISSIDNVVLEVIFRHFSQTETAMLLIDDIMKFEQNNKETIRKIIYN